MVLVEPMELESMLVVAAGGNLAKRKAVFLGGMGVLLITIMLCMYIACIETLLAV